MMCPQRGIAAQLSSFMLSCRPEGIGAPLYTSQSCTYIYCCISLVTFTATRSSKNLLHRTSTVLTVILKNNIQVAKKGAAQ